MIISYIRFSNNLVESSKGKKKTSVVSDCHSSTFSVWNKDINWQRGRPQHSVLHIIISINASLKNRRIWTTSMESHMKTLS